MGKNQFATAIKLKVDNTAYKALLDKLAGIDRKAARKAIKQGLNEISKEVLSAAKALVPVRSGQLKKSLGRKVKSLRGGAGGYAVVKPRSGVWVKFVPGMAGRKNRKGTKVFSKKFRVQYQGQMIDPVKYAHLVEYGRREVVPKKKKVLAGGGKIFGKRVRSVAPHPFMRPAWDAIRPRASGIMAKYLSAALKEFWKKRGL